MILLTNELVESESELQVMLHLPGGTRHLRCPPQLLQQHKQPALLVSWSMHTVDWCLWWLSVVLGLSVMHLVTSPTPAETNNLTQKTNRYKTPPCTMHIPNLHTQEEFPNIYVCRQAPVTFTNHHQIETGCIFTTNIPCRTNGPLSSDWCQSI